MAATATDRKVKVPRRFQKLASRVEGAKREAELAKKRHDQARERLLEEMLSAGLVSVETEQFKHAIHKETRRNIDATWFREVCGEKGVADDIIDRSIKTVESVDKDAALLLLGQQLDDWLAADHLIKTSSILTMKSRKVA